MKVRFKFPKGKWDSLEVKNRAELAALQDGILKGCKLKVEPDKSDKRLYNAPMQRICGYR